MLTSFSHLLTGCVTWGTALHCLVPPIPRLKNGEIPSKPLTMGWIAYDGLSLVHTSRNGIQIIKTVHPFLRQGLGAT